VDLTDKVVDVIFHVFDANCDGSLSSEEFLRSLQRRESDIRQPATSGFVGMVSCWLNCMKCSL
jgi:calcium uptake protein 1, mitochondrial